MLKLAGSAPATRKMRFRHMVASLRVRSQKISRMRRCIPVFGRNALVRIRLRKFSMGFTKGAENRMKLLTLATDAAGAKPIITSIFWFNSGWVIIATQNTAVPIK